MADFKKIQDFTRSKDAKHQYQDPTYLSFLLLFDFADNIHSPFLSDRAENYLKELAGENESPENVAGQSPTNAVSQKYAKRLEALRNFKKALKTINTELPWYWQSLSGLERIQQYNPQNAYFGGDDAKLTIGTLESINLTVAGLMHLYRKATFDEEKWTWILPENLRKFRMYVYVTEVREIKNMSKPTMTKKPSLDAFPSNLKPSVGMDNSNSGISGSENRPYFMFALKHCEFDVASGTTIFTDLKKSPEEAATGEIVISYEGLMDIESRTLNGIVETKYDLNDLSPAPEGEDRTPETLKDWAITQADQKLRDLEDRAVTELKTRGINRINELAAEAKRQTVGRINAEINNVFQDFVQGVDRDLTPQQQATNIKAAIADNVHNLTEEGNTIGDALNSAAKNSLGNVYGN